MVLFKQRPGPDLGLGTDRKRSSRRRGDWGVTAPRREPSGRRSRVCQGGPKVRDGSVCRADRSETLTRPIYDPSEPLGVRGLAAAAPDSSSTNGADDHPRRPPLGQLRRAAAEDVEAGFLCPLARRGGGRGPEVHGGATGDLLQAAAGGGSHDRHHAKPCSGLTTGRASGGGCPDRRARVCQGDAQGGRWVRVPRRPLANHRGRADLSSRSRTPARV